MYNVLLVDNEPAITKGLRRLISWESYDCRIAGCAANGAEALRLMDSVPMDVVITDIRMPEMDGMTLCEKIRERDQHAQLIILTGFPDFEYAHKAISFEAVDFILKPTTEDALKGALQKALRKLDASPAHGEENRIALERQIVLSDLMFSGEHSALYYMNRLNDAGMRLDDFVVLGLRYPASESEEENRLRAKKLSSFFEKQKETPDAYFLQKSDNKCYAVLCGAKEARVMRLCGEILNEIERETDYTLAIGVSARHNDPLSLRRAAEEADDARRLAMYDSQTSVMSYDALPKLSSDAGKRIFEKIKLTQTALENRNREALTRNMDNLFAMMEEEAIPFSTARQTARLLYNFGAGVLFSHNLQLEKSESAEDALKGDTLSELKDALGRYFKEIMLRLNRTEGSDDAIIDRIRSYIDENTGADLSLDTLAEMAHLSPSYFSRLFKRRMGENLSAYILQKRIDYACELLQTTDKKVYEIAEEIGVGDPVYFSKIFKKVTGKKPKEYRA